MREFKKIILVTGTPGVGKTIVSKKLASIIEATYLGITQFIEDEKISCDLDFERKTLIVDTKIVAKKLQEIRTNFKGLIIIEGHFAVDVVPIKDVNTVFVLRRDPHELKNVLKNRGYEEKKILENLNAEILDVCLCDAISTCGLNKVCEIDVTDKTVENVLEEMICVLENKKKCKTGIVNWLEKLEKEGKLDEFNWNND